MAATGRLLHMKMSHFGQMKRLFTCSWCNKGTNLMKIQDGSIRNHLLQKSITIQQVNSDFNLTLTNSHEMSSAILKDCYILCVT